jgi:hypothetical protein
MHFSQSSFVSHALIRVPTPHFVQSTQPKRISFSLSGLE